MNPVILDPFDIAFICCQVRSYARYSGQHKERVDDCGVCVCVDKQLVARAWAWEIDHMVGDVNRGNHKQSTQDKTHATCD